jgi:replicative superfamily II helicase
MYLSDLSKWGIPECVLQRWRERQGELLLPVQSKAVCQGLLGSPSPADQQHPVNVLITAPTSSGKSFCAELAGLKAVSARRRTVMLFPLKSLAEQKYRLFRQTYGPLGIKCLIVTGDHPENDRPFVEGKFQLALAIYEKLDQLLTTSLDSLKNVGTVVVDEIQTIAEPGRGAVLERLLTKILASSYTPTLVGLSAVLGGGDRPAGRSAPRGGRRRFVLLSFLQQSPGGFPAFCQNRGG